MTVEDLIVELKKVNGHLTVVAYDGSDPSDLREVSRVDVEDLRFFSADCEGYPKKLAVHLN